MDRRWIIGGLIAVGLLVVVLYWPSGPGGVLDGVYTSGRSDVPVHKIAEDMGLITRVATTPDYAAMFVANLSGDVYVLERRGSRYVKQEVPFYHVDTGFDYEAGDENGLTGIVVSGHYAESHKVFLLYAQQDDGVGQSQILSLVARRDDTGNLVGTEPQVIFRGNVMARGAHQIQDAASVDIAGRPHVLFSIGESYVPAYARQLAREAGKIMLIQEDGSDPVGERPYPQYPKVQAIGIRNAYGLDVVPGTEWVYVTDNGPDANDRLILAPLLDPSLQFDFGWNGNPASMLQTRRNGVLAPELVMAHWPVPVSPAEIIAESRESFVATTFSTSYEHASYVWRGLVNTDSQLVDTQSESPRAKRGLVFYQDSWDLAD